MTPVLQCDGLCAGYGTVTVVRDFNLELRSGELVAMLGPNGAGKTTVMLTLAGLVPARDGRILSEGHELTRLGASKINKRGVVLVPDDRSLFTTLTVRENLALARRRDGPGEEGALSYFPQLRSRLKMTAGSLSGGEQQMLAIARALMQSPKVLLIDEVSMGLAPIVVEHLLPTLREVAANTGAGVVFVEQHVRLAVAVADKALVLVHGSVVLDCEATELRGDPLRLERAYLGAASSQL